MTTANQTDALLTKLLVNLDDRPLTLSTVLARSMWAMLRGDSWKPTNVHAPGEHALNRHIEVFTDTDQGDLVYDETLYFTPLKGKKVRLTWTSVKVETEADYLATAMAPDTED
jgi:hypothetical protein